MNPEPATTQDRLTERFERGLLGALLRWPAALDDVSACLKPHMFYLEDDGPGGRLFRVLLELQSEQRPIDLVTVADRLHQKDWLLDLGGYSVLAALWDNEPTGAHAVYYAGKVRDAHLSRSLGSLGRQMVQEANQPTQEPLVALEGFETAFLGLSELGVSGSARHIRPDVDTSFDAFDARKAGRLLGLATGWPDLDDILAGLHASEFLVVAARPSVGKTAFGSCLARHLTVEQNEPVFFASLEQSRQELVDRLLCCEARVDAQRFRLGLLARGEISQVHEAGNRLRDAPLYLDDAGEQGMSRIAANARRVKRQHGLACVIVDYLQLVQPDNKREDRHLQVGGISRRLKLLAKELAVPVVALAQLNRSVEERRDRPRLADLRESGSIEADADTVLLLHRPEKPDGPTSLIEVLVAKQRNGPTGDLTLVYQRPFLRFESFAPGVPA